MKKLIILISIAGLQACTEAGTLRKISDDSKANIEVYEYFYEDGSRIFVARFKDCPKVATTTWIVEQEKYQRQEKAITVSE